jgi:hypothetical protein
MRFPNYSPASLINCSACFSASAVTRSPESILPISFVRCAGVSSTVDHPLANREYLVPFASVVEVPQAQLPEPLGQSLVVTAITNDAAFRQRLLSSNLVGRLNFAATPTGQITWDQPHEGNLFDHLYARRAFQAA